MYALLARGLNSFDNWFEKDLDDFANEQLGLAGYATSMVTRGTFQGEDAMEDKRLAAIGPNPSGLCMCGCGRKTKIVTKSDSATRSCNGSAFSIYSWPQSPRREGSKQIQTSSPYSGYLPRASRRDGSRMPSIPKRFSQSKETSLVRK